MTGRREPLSRPRPVTKRSAALSLLRRQRRAGELSGTERTGSVDPVEQLLRLALHVEAGILMCLIAG